MDADQTGPRMPAPDTPHLLQSAQRAALRASTDADLRRLALSLATACEAARIAALRNMPGPAQQAGDDGGADPNCGFAALFDALRRTRAEIKRRDKATYRMATTTSGKAMKPGNWNARLRASTTAPKVRR